MDTGKSNAVYVATEGGALPVFHINSLNPDTVNNSVDKSQEDSKGSFLGGKSGTEFASLGLSLIAGQQDSNGRSQSSFAQGLEPRTQRPQKHLEPQHHSSEINNKDDFASQLESSKNILKSAIAEFKPTHIVSMVSGGKDSASSHAVLQEFGVRPDFIIHGNTRCGIPETSEFVRDYYGSAGPDFVEADAGTAYEDYVLRKGFFGKGISAHAFAYRVLKATPFRKAISKSIRMGKRDIRVLLINGARKDESENRKKHLQVWRQDPAQKGNIWVNLIHDWTQRDRDQFLDSRKVKINPVAEALCRSGECMCGTMQQRAERVEAAALYPKWGSWIDKLEAEVKEKFGFGWGDSFPRKEKPMPLFQPMCKDCLNVNG